MWTYGRKYRVEWGHISIRIGRGYQVSVIDASRFEQREGIPKCHYAGRWQSNGSEEQDPLQHVEGCVHWQV